MKDYLQLVYVMVKPSKKTLLFIICAILISALLFMYVSSKGVEAPPTETVAVSGYIYMSASDPDSESTSVDTYAYDLVGKKIVRLTEYGNYLNFAPMDANRGLFVTTDETYQGEGPDYFLTIIENLSDGTHEKLYTPSVYSERMLTASPDGQYIALAGQEIPDPGRDISTWQVYISDQFEDTHVVITEAVSPRWINGGEDVLFIKNDGIYKYNILNAVEEKVFAEYTDFSAYSEMAVSADQRYIVITSPAVESRVIVLAVDTDLNMIEIGSHVESEFIHLTPVISPDSLQYGFLVLDKESSELPAVLEIYSFGKYEVVHQVSLDTFPIDYLELNHWSDTFLLDTAIENTVR
jgi:hypothetical protein